MKYQMNADKGIVNRGNLERLKNLMKRAQNGEKLVIGFIGGSITQGSLATEEKNCYAHRVFDWWKAMFPGAEFTYINAGIGGTDSQFGVARVETDLLIHKPDFVIVEFSVNDQANAHYMETYEGLVRKIYASLTRPAILLVHSVYYDSGANAQIWHGKIGRYYQLPAVSMQSSIYDEVVQGRIEASSITEDNLHPNDTGHELMAWVITYFLEKVFLERNLLEEEAPVLPTPMTKNEFAHSRRYLNNNCAPEMQGFAPDMTPQQGITDCFRGGWIAEKKGDTITFEVVGKAIGVQYRRTRQKPAMTAEVVIDGAQDCAIRLDGGFDETWGDKLELVTVAEGLENKIHSVTITMVEGQEKDVAPFYLVSVIAS